MSRASASIFSALMAAGHLAPGTRMIESHLGRFSLGLQIRGALPQDHPARRCHLQPEANPKLISESARIPMPIGELSY
jgi:hypothetical protein